MDVSLNIPASRKLTLQIVSYSIMFILALLIGTALRISLLVIYPLIALMIAAYYNFKITSSFLLLLALVILSFAGSLFGHLYLKYNLLSLFYMLPFLLLLFSNPT